MKASAYRPVSIVVSLNLTYRHLQKAIFSQAIETKPKYKINTWNLAVNLHKALWQHIAISNLKHYLNYSGTAPPGRLVITATFLSQRN